MSKLIRLNHKNLDYIIQGVSFKIISLDAMVAEGTCKLSNEEVAEAKISMMNDLCKFRNMRNK